MSDSILDGCSEIVDEFYECNIGKRTPLYNDRSNYLNICNKYNDILLKPHYEDVIKKMYNTIDDNYSKSMYKNKGKSEKNWRWEPQKKIDEKNESTEKRLEKAIVILNKDNSWINQVPTASGLCSSKADKARNVDIIHKVRDNVYEFIELKAKLGTNNPFYASIEIIQYALLYIFFRKKIYGNVIKNKKPLLEAEEIHLVVLAPIEYYKYFTNDCAKVLQEQFSNDLNKLVQYLNIQNIKFFFSYQFINEKVSDIKEKLEDEIFYKINEAQVEIKNDRIREYIKDLFDKRKDYLSSL